MRRRLCVIGAALSAVPLAFGATAAAAATGGGSTGATKPVKVVCHSNISIMVAPNDTGITPPVQQGNQYGSITCGKGLGTGVQADSFNIPDSGYTETKYVLFLKTGTIHGTYELIPQQGAFTGTSFTEVDSIGTLKVLGGTGTFQGAKGTGTMTCTSVDEIHTTCTNHLKFKVL